MIKWSECSLFLGSPVLLSCNTWAWKMGIIPPHGELKLRDAGLRVDTVKWAKLVLSILSSLVIRNSLQSVSSTLSTPVAEWTINIWWKDKWINGECWGYCNRTIKTKVIEASTLRTILGQATSRESDYYGPQVKVRLDPSSPTTLLVAVRFPGV